MTPSIEFVLHAVSVESTVRLLAKSAGTGGGKSKKLRFSFAFPPVVSAYTLKAAGVDSRSTWKRLLVNSATSFAINAAFTYGLKYTVKSTRPDGTDNHSFPSGHTSFAFFGAAILDKEFRRVSPWISVAGYSVAAVTAVDRVRRNRHHWADVLAGAAIGVLSVEAGYWLGDKMTGWGDNVSLALCPVGVSLVVGL